MPDIFVSPTETATPEPIVATVQTQTAQPAATPVVQASLTTSAGPFATFSENPGNISFQTQEHDEHILLFLRRHIITNLPWILTSLILMLFPLLFLIINMLLPFANLFPGFSLSTNYWVLITLSYYLAVLAFIFAKFIDWFYNISIVTDKRIVDIDYSNLISHDIAMTKVDLVEDVRYTQMGFVQSLFNYGDVFVQTAGKHENFDFLKTPKPVRTTTIIESLIGKDKV